MDLLRHGHVSWASDGPVLIWFEHTPYSELDLQSALAATDMTGLELAQLSAIVTRTGFVLRADRPY